MEKLFHLSLPCENLVETKVFYVDTIGASLGRYTNNWLDINLFGHQVTFTKAGKFDFTNPSYKFEGNVLSSFHFGIILNKEAWENVYSKLKIQDLDITAKATFLKNKSGEHESFFVKDPNDYMIEFKCFSNPNDIYNR